MPFDPAYFIVDYDPAWPALYEAERQRLVARGRERAAGLTWERSAELVDAAIEPLLGDVVTGRGP